MEIGYEANTGMWVELWSIQEELTWI